MSGDPISDVAVAVTSVAELTNDILDRIDRDKPLKTLTDENTQIDNSFGPNGSLDRQWELAYKLLSDIGRPVTTGGTVGDVERQFRHNALICIAELKYLKTCLIRANAK